jgi:predicted TIM-barrel fold metal-dependent hydrolase
LATLDGCVHLRTHSKEYGATDARAFIEQVLPAAPAVPVQFAHMAGWGGYDRATDEALGAFVEAMRQGRLRRRQLYFDLSAVLLPGSAYETQPGRELVCFGEEMRLLAEQQRGYPGWEARPVRRIRQVGLDHVLFATDWPVASPADYQALVREQLHLSTKEVRRLSANVALYLR